MEVVTDETWKTREGPITFSSTYGGEDYDARREMIGWDRAGFDESQWSAAVAADGPGGMLRPELAPPIRVMHTYVPVHRSAAKAGSHRLRPGAKFRGMARHHGERAGGRDGEADRRRVAERRRDCVAAKFRRAAMVFVHAEGRLA